MPVVAKKIQLGETYRTLGVGPVEIIQERIAGRKIFVGRLEDGTVINYFRNGRFSNASQRKGGHKFDIVNATKKRK